MPPVEEAVFMMVEEMPSFPGGDSELYQFFNKHMLYPQDARENGVEGKVVVKFVVTSEGKIINPVVMRSVSESIDREALRVINLLPLWIPGKQNGRPVSVYFTLPVTFTLN